MSEDVLTDAIGDLRSLIEGNGEAEGCLRTITDAISRVRTLADDWTRMAEYQKRDAPIDVLISCSFKGCANEVRSALAGGRHDEREEDDQ